MAIRKDGIVISDELLEKLNSLGFSNETSHKFTVEEVYIAKIIHDCGFKFEQLNSNYIFDVESKSVRTVKYSSETSIFFSNSNNEDSEISFDKILILPTWAEAREWLKNKNFIMEFHYDPFKEGNIKIGFMKPKSFTATDNLVIESHGKTDLEVIYKIILEVIKYENNLNT
ncbi:MAG: hypothetical protein U0354_08550 [Candidatus Sericytochromatia bacterium]